MRTAFPTGSLPDGLLARIQARDAEKPFSLFWEARACLSLGVLSLSAGLGILVYKNIGTIGHQAILAAIALGALACFAYCFRRAPAFAWENVPRIASGADYALWLGALLTGTFVGYLQARYSPFGEHTAIALVLPAVFYLFLAYRFDHRGVLQLGVAGLCAAAGVAVTPVAAMRAGLFDSHQPVFTGLVLAGAWGIASWLSGRRGWKPHFAFSYGNFAAHLLFLSCIGGMSANRGLGEAAYFLLAAAGAGGLFVYARRLRSAYYVLVAVAYGYVAVTIMVFRHMLISGWASIEMGFLYFLLSCAGAIGLFLNLKGLQGSESSGEEHAGL
ncbi:MAG: DUF2157 domain-containing protein [Fibrobacteres bacterium]|nr:DUF2157 domain-containing protein [Fibrobacterota bacterium]